MDTKSPAGPPPPPPTSDDLPPTYTEASTSKPDNGIIDPISLLLSRGTIFSIPSTPSLQPPTPAYTLDRAPATLTHSTSTITFSRVDTLISPTSTSLKTRERHLYNLRRQDSPLFSERGARFFAEAQTRRAGITTGPKRAQNLAIVSGGAIEKAAGFFKRKSDDSSRSADLRGAACDTSGQTRKERANKKGVDDDEILFALFKHPAGGFEWRMEYSPDVEGDRGWRAVATEEPLLAGDGTKEHRLVMARPLGREVLDALVALWCCRVWAASAEEHAEGVRAGMSRGDKLRRNLKLGGELYGAAQASCYGAPGGKR